MGDEEEVILVDSRFPTDAFSEKVCPLIGGVCKKEGCLAYKKSVSEWDDTVLQDQPGLVDDVMVTKSTEVVTGKRYKGVIHQCNLGVFERTVDNVQLVSETEIVKSGIILDSKG